MTKLPSFVTALFPHKAEEATSTEAGLTPAYLTWLQRLLVLALTLRLLVMGIPPLFDTTESRYANIAQHLLLRNDWLIPYLQAFNLPFLGKPPLSFWLEGLSIEWLGCSEWALRLPNLVESLLALLFTGLIAQRLYQHSPQQKSITWLALWFLASSGFFFVIGMSVSMDMMVATTTTGAMWSLLELWYAHKQGQRRWPWVLSLCACLCAGSLNKGLVTWVMFLPPLVLWSLLQAKNGLLQVKQLLATLPWVSLLVGHLLLVAPWFILVQQQQPDFLYYFFVQEHLLRFITPNYGDRYGDGHIKPRGTSWLYLITACLPWIAYWLAWCPALVAHIKRIKSSSWLTTLKTLVVRFYQWQQAHPTLSFLLCWGCFAPLFFTLARSIIITYIITALPPLAILTSVGMHHVWKHGSSTTQKYWQQGILALGGLVMFGVCGWYASWLLAPSSHAIASRHTMHPFVNTFTPTTSEQQRHTHTPATFIQKLLWPQHRSLKKLVAALPERSPTGEALASATTYAWQEAHAPFSYYVYTQQTQTEQQRQRPWQQRTPQKARSIEGWLQPTLPTAVKNKGYLLLINTTDTAAVQKLKNALHRLKQQGRTVHVYRLTSHASVFDIVWVSYF